MPRRKEAYILVNAGRFYATEYPSQRRICSNARFRDAVYRARRRGYAVRLYGGSMYKPMKILPALV